MNEGPLRSSRKRKQRYPTDGDANDADAHQIKNNKTGKHDLKPRTSSTSTGGPTKMKNTTPVPK